MLDRTLRALCWALRLCMPAPTGRHRQLVAVTHAPVLPGGPPPRFTERLDGAASAIVRPYVYLATVGIDVGPRPELIHGGAR